MAPADKSKAEDMAANADEMKNLVATTGSLLGAARRECGRSLEDIAEETRVPRRHLRALEADEHEGLPALPYALGFVRNFARAVNLDPETMASRFRAETSKQPHVPQLTTFEPLDERRLPGRTIVVITLVGLVALVAGLSAWGSGVFDPAIPDAPLVTGQAPERLPRVAPPPPADALAAGMLATDAISPPPADTQAALSGSAIVLTAKEDVWVRVYDPASSLVPISRVMQAGERFEVPADPPGLMLWTGKAGALEVKIGDAVLPPLGDMTQTLRDIRLTPEGLRAQSASTSNPDMRSGVS